MDLEELVLNTVTKELILYLKSFVFVELEHISASRQSLFGINFFQ